MSNIETAKGFIGLSKKAAQNKAEQLNLIFRLVRKDDKPYLGYPEDLRNDRVCIEMEKNKVVKATIQ